MNNMTRTLIYVVFAAIMATLAIWKGTPAPEMNASDFSETGKEYYPDFDNPNEATGIRVVTYDEKTSDIKPFEVQFKNGLWRIPSHYDYPVDGEEQLGKTAASLVGVKRGAVAGESELDFKRLGVVDPLTDDDTLKEFSGDRLTLTKGETVLVDLIIGKQVPERNGFYYVRKPDEKLTYVAELDIDLSTRFSDWIEPDLLKLDQNKLRKIDVRDYSVDEQRGAILISDYFELNRKTQTDPWVMEVYDPQTKKLKETITTLKTSELNGIINSLGDLEIAGVRPKPSFISSGLKLSGEVKPSREASLFLQQRGFFFAQSPDRKSLEIFSNQGDLTATTEEGVAYVLRFGAVFTGDEFDIEVGSVKPKEEKKETETESNKDDKGEESKDSEGKNKSRYLFVSVQFDQSALGDAPVKPTPPAKGKTDEKKPATEKKSDEKAETKPEVKKEEKSKEEKPADKKEEKEADQPDPQKEYEAALAKYETDLKAYQEKVEAGKKEVEKLNKRFADWYYVIDAASFDKLHKSRTDLVEVKEPEKKETTDPAEPASKPETKKPETPAAPAAKKMEKKAESKKPEAPKKEEKKAEPVKGEEKKPTPETKPATTKPVPAKEKKPAEAKKATKPPASEGSKPKEAPKTEKKPAS